MQWWWKTMADTELAIIDDPWIPEKKRSAAQSKAMREWYEKHKNKVVTTVDNGHRDGDADGG